MLLQFLGLLMGHIEITKRIARAIPEILKEWMWIFEKTTTYMIYHITPKALTTKMLEVDADDPWFKRHFALLVMSVLIDPMVNGYVNQNYIDHLWDVENITNLNWCQMVINALVSSKLGWEKNIVKIFGGPILFLTVFYIDRVVPYRRSVPRSFPAFSLGLTQEEKNQRWDDVSAVAREYSESQTGEGEVSEQRAHVRERAQQIETKITALTDEKITRGDLSSKRRSKAGSEGRDADLKSSLPPPPPLDVEHANRWSNLKPPSPLTLDLDLDLNLKMPSNDVAEENGHCWLFDALRLGDD
nr:uncharacterized protein LOC109191529 [Ipomoea trifida]